MSETAAETSAPGDADPYVVVVNDEEQYSIWAANRPLPAGWHVEGFRGSRESCLDHVEEVWTDMRPLSVRRQMESQSRP